MLAYNDMETADAISTSIALGIELNEADFAKEESCNELNDNELDAVSGGGGCECMIAGGGGGTDKVDGNTYGCACIAYGQGGDGRADDVNCACPFAGSGSDW